MAVIFDSHKLVSTRKNKMATLFKKGLKECRVGPLRKYHSAHAQAELHAGLANNKIRQTTHEHAGKWNGDHQLDRDAIRAYICEVGDS